MTVPFRIREAGLDDNERLIELARRCPTKGTLDIYSDRFPDFFAMTRQQGERSYVYVGESLQGDVVACAVLVERREQYEGELVKVLHFADLRIHPSVRRTRIATKLIQLYSDRLLTGNYHHGVVEILKSNAAPSRANTLLRSQMHIGRATKVTMYKLLPIWNYKLSKKWEYRQARRSDLPALAKLLQSVYRGVPGAPHFSIEWLQEALQKHGSFSLANIYVAHTSEGELSACVASWDQTSLRKTVVLRYPRLLKMFVRTLSMFGLLLKIPPLPKEGRSLRIKYFRWVAAKPEGLPALQSLMRFVLRKVKQERTYQCVMVGFSDSDRLKASVRGLFKWREPLHIYSHHVVSPELSLPVPKARSLSVKPAKQQLYVDLALI